MNGAVQMDSHPVKMGPHKSKGAAWRNAAGVSGDVAREKDRFR